MKSFHFLVDQWSIKINCWNGSILRKDFPKRFYFNREKWITKTRKIFNLRSVLTNFIWNSYFVENESLDLLKIGQFPSTVFLSLFVNLRMNLKYHSLKLRGRLRMKLRMNLRVHFRQFLWINFSIFIGNFLSLTVWFFKPLSHYFNCKKQ